MTRPSPPICCRGLSVGYDKEPVLEDLSFTVGKGSTVALVGRSGCGKTTLLKTLAGILDPLAGEAVVLNTSLPQSPPPGELGYIPQSLGLVTHETVLTNVLHGRLSDIGKTRSLLGRFPKDTKTEAREAIERVGLREYQQNRVKELSGGQRRRVAIARSFVQKPRVLLADEMLSELDTETAKSIVECLATLQAETDMTVVIVEHNLDMAKDISDTVLRLGDEGIKDRIESVSTREPVTRQSNE